MWAAHGGVHAEAVGHVLGELEREREILWVSDGPFGQGLKMLEGCGPVREQREARERGGGLSRCGEQQVWPQEERREAHGGRSLDIKPHGCFLLDGGISVFTS